LHPIHKLKEIMKRTQLRFGKGFRVALGNRRSQAAEMVLPPDDKEGDSKNRHHGADQWIFVVSGKGRAAVNGKRYTLKAGTLMLIERDDKHEILDTGRTNLGTLNFYVPPAYSKNGNPLPPTKPGGS
jgi:mannose-6-phosphate isomerase-like protein (cupin superfamily)